MSAIVKESQSFVVHDIEKGQLNVRFGNIFGNHCTVVYFSSSSAGLIISYKLCHACRQGHLSDLKGIDELG